MNYFSVGFPAAKTAGDSNSGGRKKKKCRKRRKRCKKRSNS